MTRKQREQIQPYHSEHKLPKMPLQHFGVSATGAMCNLPSWTENDSRGRIVKKGVAKRQGLISSKSYRLTVTYLIGKAK